MCVCLHVCVCVCVYMYVCACICVGGCPPVCACVCLQYIGMGGKSALRCDFVEFDVVMFSECFENVWEFNGKCHTFVSMDFKNLQCRAWLHRSQPNYALKTTAVK